MNQHPFGRYTLVDKIATGGMAEIYLAKLKGIEGFEKTLVIKRILPHWSSNKDFIAMLIDEAKIVVQLNHANIVQVMELGREQETYYIAMEYVDGIDLKRLSTSVLQKKGRLPPRLAAFITGEFLKGLTYAHNKTDSSGQNLGLVHRDISPQNILISFTGEVKITDFGIAKAAIRSTETVTGALKGKFAYMSPEQAQGEVVDARTDVFAAGIILYELLTGRRLFGGGRSDIDTLDQVRNATVRFTDADRAELPAPLQQIILNALQKEMTERYQTARDFFTDLGQFAVQEWGATTGDDLQDYLASVLNPEIAARRKFLTSISDRTLALPAGIDVGNDAAKSLTRDDATDPLGTETLQPGVEPSLSEGFSSISVPRSEEILVSRLVSIPGIKQKLSGTLRIPWKSFVVVAILMVAGAITWYQGRPGTAVKTLAPVAATEVRDMAGALPVSAGAAPAVPAPVQTETPPLQPVVDPNLPGTLEVQATPWGLVTVDGGARLETPLRSLSLAPGSHAVGVSYPPYKTTVTENVTIGPQRHTVCAAKFAKGGSLFKCK